MAWREGKSCLSQQRCETLAVTLCTAYRVVGDGRVTVLQDRPLQDCGTVDSVSFAYFGAQT